MVGVWLFLGDNFNLVVYLQLVGEWYNAFVNFCFDAVVFDIIVDVVSEV